MLILIRAILLGFVGIALIGSLAEAVASEPTKAQQLRVRVSPKDLKEIRTNMSEMKSENRWPKDQQERYIKSCEKTKPREPSINRRTCECMLEVMMDKFATLGDHAKDLMDTGGKPDEETSTLFGLCLVAFGN